MLQSILRLAATASRAPCSTLSLRQIGKLPVRSISLATRRYTSARVPPSQRALHSSPRYQQAVQISEKAAQTALEDNASYAGRHIGP
jgi:hypothetical protein